MKNLPRPVTAMPFAFLIGALFWATTLSLSHAEESRSWTSKDGQETLEGSYVSQSGNTVLIRLANGQPRHLPIDRLSDADIEFVRARSVPDPALVASAPVPAQLGKIGEQLQGKLVNATGQEVDLMAEREEAPEYYIFYYSASWCPPCRAYTPELVRFYNRNQKSNIEVVLVPSDRTEEDALAYLKDYRMKFPMLDYTQKKTAGIPGNPGSGIPALRMVRSDGETVLTSAEVNRSEFLKKALELAQN